MNNDQPTREVAPDVEQKMNALCKQISVAHNLDAEIQEELYGHMEDKLLAYLNGEETVRGEDALLLVKEHFGDPRVLKDLFHEVHSEQAQASLLRRVAAVWLVFTGVAWATGLCVGLLFLGLVPLATKLGSTPTLAGAWPYGCIVAPFVIVALTVALTALVLRRWKRRDLCVSRPWYLRWSPAKLAAACILVLLVREAVPGIMLYSTQPGSIPWGPWGLAALLAGTFIPSALLWIWWCDDSPRTFKTAYQGAAAWSLLIIAHEALRQFFSVGWAISDGPSRQIPGTLHVLAHGDFVGSPYSWQLVLQWGSVNSLLGTASVFIMLIVGGIAFATVAVLMYRAAVLLTSRFNGFHMA